MSQLFRVTYGGFLVNYQVRAPAAEAFGVPAADWLCSDEARKPQQHT